MAKKARHGRDHNGAKNAGVEARHPSHQGFRREAATPERKVPRKRRMTPLWYTAIK